MELEKLEKIRKEQCEDYNNALSKAKLWKIMIIVFFVLFGLSGLISAASMSGAGFFLAIPMIFGFGLSGTLAGKYSNQANKINKDYESKIKSIYIEELISKHYTQTTFLDNNHINIGKVLSSNLVKNPDEFKGEDYITGYYKNLEFEFCELTLVDINKSKNNTTTRTVYFQGFWLVINLPYKLDGDIIVVENNLGNRVNNLDKVETEMIVFNNIFSSYTNNKQLFFKVFNPSRMESILKLEAMHKGKILYSFKQNQLHVAVNNGANLFMPNINIELTQEIINDLEEEVLLIKSVIDLLKIDQI